MCKSLFDNLKLRKDLAACNAAYSLLKADNALCQKQVESLNENLATTLTALKSSERDLIELIRVNDLMENGPGAPKVKPRVLTYPVMVNKLIETFGERHTNCPSKLISDSDWLVSTTEDFQFYLDYYSMFWLPKIKPYTVIEWTKLDGTVVRIMGRDCDDFSDFLHGIPTLHIDWTALPWGLMWAEIEGVFIAGYHAFNWTITMDPATFDETSSAGLSLWLIEPQGSNQMWVPTREGDISVTIADKLVAQPMAKFNVKSIGVIKV